MQTSWAARTDPGLRRYENEDRICANPKLGLFVVADGMGGHAGGEVASQLAVESIQAMTQETNGLGPKDTWPIPFDHHVGNNGNRLRAGFDFANKCIAKRAFETNSLQGMGTTAVAILLADTTVALAHVGDSRAYLFRDEKLARLTRDHSWVEEQVQAGMLTEAAARNHPRRNIVTRAISGGELDVELSELSLKTGDRLMLCSDGLSTVLTDQEIEEVISRTTDAQASCDELVRLTNAEGGPDNVTVLILDVNS